MRNGIPATSHPALPHRASVSSSCTSSTPSSGKNAGHQGNPTTHRRRLKAQYPAGSSERHVEYILVAAFHVDRGPIMEHQYPGAISGDENMLAELMLPDQAHMRNEDWTIFFLHKDSSEAANHDTETSNGMKRRTRSEDGETEKSETDVGEVNDVDLEKIGIDGEGDREEEMEGGEGPPLIYVLNLVNTKQDNTVKRSATLTFFHDPG